MLWASDNLKNIFIAFLVIWGLGLLGQTILRMSGWSWWARIGVLIPVYTVAIRMLYKLLNNSVFVLI